MRSKRSFLILLVITIVVVAAAVLSQRSTNESEPSYGLQVPGLASKLETVHTVVLSESGDTLRLERTQDGWVAQSKDNYPANADRIRQLVLGISQMQRLEKKTRDPKRYALLKLQDIDKAGSKAVQVALLTAGNKKLADLLVGKTREFETTTRSKYFVRNVGDPQSWLVEASLPPVVGDMSDWLQHDLLPGVGKSDIESATVTHPGGGSFTVRRDSGKQANFQLAALKPDEKIDNQYSLNAIPETLERLALKDVGEADSLKDAKVVLTVQARTFNGVDIVARFGHLSPDYSVRLKASYDPAQDQTKEKQAAGAKAGSQAGGKDQGSAKNDKSGSEKKSQSGAGNKDNKEKKPAVSGGELAQNLNKLWHGRYFVVSKYSLDTLNVHRSDLVKAKTPKKSSKAKSSKTQ